MRHYDGDSFTRQYDACHYIVTRDKSLKQALKLNFLLLRQSEMNVFIWEGTDRERALTPVVPGNEQPRVGSLYQVEADSGFLIVAYPNKGAQTELKFEVWVTLTGDNAD